MVKKVIAKKSKSGLATTEKMPAYMEQDSHRGDENVGTDDLSIPRLDVIQALSPQRKKSDPAYIEGAEEGQLFNSVTQELYGTEVRFVPVYFRKEWLVWKDRDAGGGFCGAYPTPAEANATRNELGTDTHEVMDTGQHFGIIVSDDGMEEVVISMSRSKMKASRQLNTLCKMAGGDRFGSMYEVSAIEVSGDKGDYWNLGIKRLGYVSEEVYHAGEKLYDAVCTGIKGVKYDEATGEASTDEQF